MRVTMVAACLCLILTAGTTAWVYMLVGSDPGSVAAFTAWSTFAYTLATFWLVLLAGVAGYFARGQMVAQHAQLAIQARQLALQARMSRRAVRPHLVSEFKTIVLTSDSLSLPLVNVGAGPASNVVAHAWVEPLAPRAEAFRANADVALAEAMESVSGTQPDFQLSTAGLASNRSVDGWYLLDDSEFQGAPNTDYLVIVHVTFRDLFGKELQVSWGEVPVQVDDDPSGAPSPRTM